MNGDDVHEMEAFFRKTEAAVTRTARRLGSVLGLGDERVEDAIQRAYEVAFRKWTQLNSDEQLHERSDGLVGWICTTVRNKVLAEYNSQQKFTELGENFDIPDPDLDIAASAVDSIVHVARFKCLQKALKVAPRQIVELVVIYLAAEGSHIDRIRTIADYEKISVDAARKRFERAMPTLQKIMIQLDEDPEGGFRDRE